MSNESFFEWSRGKLVDFCGWSKSSREAVIAERELTLSQRDLLPPECKRLSEIDDMLRREIEVMRTLHEDDILRQRVKSGKMN